MYRNLNCPTRARARTFTRRFKKIPAWTLILPLLAAAQVQAQSLFPGVLPGLPIDSNLPLGYEPSGAIWHPRLGKLFVVSDGGIVSSMDADGNNVQHWSVPGDLEGICIADPATNFVYVANEVPARVYEFNFVTSQITRVFDLSGWMPAPTNAGMEALTFVSSATDAEGGVFYAGHQENGRIYKFRLPIRSSQTSTSVTYLGTVTPVAGRTDIADLCYDANCNVLYILYDNADIIRAVRPANMALIEEWFVPGIQQEGIAVKPPCDVFIADDTGLLTRYTGFPSGDYDGDGVSNCDDGCPGDSNKSAPGQCGCGTPDTDSDGDGVANCLDACPNDSTKIAPGQCGCGIPDTDSDADGAADCSDQCPFDSAKVAPGQCGCGVSDTDSDHDGVADCRDLCPDTPAGQPVNPKGCSCGAIPGDVNADGHVDGTDLQAFLDMLMIPGSGSPAAQCAADLDGNGVVDDADLQKFRLLLLTASGLISGG